MSAFATWLDTFLDEKGIDPESYTFIVETPGKFWDTHIIPLESVIAAAKGVSAAEQLVIKNTLVKLDFCNQPVVPYFQHLANALAEAFDQ